MGDTDWDRDRVSIALELTTFQKRTLAVQYADDINISRLANNESMTTVFSREITRKGHRYFFVEDLSSFYQKYMTLSARDRTMYEIIRADFPCRLFFDIEFNKGLNAGRDGERSMTIFKKYLILWIKLLLGFEISESDLKSENRCAGQIVELDASNTTKFSRHIIVSLPVGYVFASGREVFKFTELLCKHITNIAAWSINDESSLSPDAVSLRKLFYLKEEGSNIRNRLFVDLSVNRDFGNFRLLLSRKFGEMGKRNFQIWLPNEQKFMDESQITEDIFKATLVSYPATMNNIGIKYVSCPTSYSSEFEASCKIMNNRDSPKLNKKLKVSHMKSGHDAGKLFPHVINFFRNDIALSWPTQCDGHSNISKSLNARIYNILYYDSPKPILILAVSGNRYCFNVGRRHVKNNIFFEINITEYSYSQKCYDYLCKDYKSAPRALPPELFFSTKKDRDDYV